MLDDNVVREMMHHETLCLTGEGVAERHIMSCCEMTMFVETDIASCHEMPCLRGEMGGTLLLLEDVTRKDINSRVGDDVAL